MKLLTFHTATDRTSRFGVLLSGDRVLDLSAVGGTLPQSVLHCIQQGDSGLAAVRAAVACGSGNACASRGCRRRSTVAGRAGLRIAAATPRACSGGGHGSNSLAPHATAYCLASRPGDAHRRPERTGVARAGARHPRGSAGCGCRTRPGDPAPPATSSDRRSGLPSHRARGDGSSLRSRR